MTTTTIPANAGRTTAVTVDRAELDRRHAAIRKTMVEDGIDLLVLYSSPLRVYLCLAALALAGLIAGMSLPISLFPNSSKPRVRVNISYGSSTATEFLDVYGRNLEGVLAGIKTDKVEVERVEANYDTRNVKFNVYFKWGVEPRAALREVQNVMNGYGARFPIEMRDSIDVQNWNQNSGFFAASFYSERRSLDEVYDILEPIMGPQISKVQDAEGAGFRCGAVSAALGYEYFSRPDCECANSGDAGFAAALASHG